MPLPVTNSVSLPKSIKVDTSIPPIERLRPDSKHHDWVLEQITRRLKGSETEMKKFHPRWKVSERKFQAYMSLPKYEQVLRDMNDSGKPPTPAIIVFPYKYAVISTIVTYLARVFCGRKPVFQLGITSPESANNVRKVETVLQYHADYQQLVAKLFQYFLDGELYGLQAMRVIWAEDWANRTTWQKPGRAMQTMGGRKLVQVRARKRIYQGNENTNCDPFMFLPDPSVPMTYCPRQGEFLFMREFLSKVKLAALEANDEVMWTDNVEPMTMGRDTMWYDLSNRNLLAGGAPNAGSQARSTRSLANIFMFDQGSVNIIPEDWGLHSDGDPEGPQKFLFGVLNKKQIIQADPLDNDHNSHPFVVGEPYTSGYAFGSPSIADYLGPIQDIMSWFLDSHIFNVRASLQNMFIVDPSRIEMADLKKPGPGKIIRLKPTAIGQDVRSALTQLQVADVTRGHMADLQVFQRIGDTVSAVSDNVRGIQPAGGRKSATESRITTEAAASRLSSHAMHISSQSISELMRYMTLNLQQYQDEELYLKILGSDAQGLIGPQGLQGNFVYPTHDGVLPLDKMANLEMWKEIFLGVQSDPQLRQSYSLPKIFEFLAEMGGAVNITSFKLVTNPDAVPNMAPMSELPPPEDKGGGSGGAPPPPNLPGPRVAPAPAGIRPRIQIPPIAV